MFIDIHVLDQGYFLTKGVIFLLNLPVLCTGRVPKRQKTHLPTCALSEDSDQPVHSRSLIRIFTGHILDSQGVKCSSC